MKTKSVILALVLASAMSAFAVQTTVTGVLTDDMCTKKHMMAGKSNADCVRDCLKHGANFVIVSQGKVIKVQGKDDLLNELRGKRVTLAGELKGQVLSVTSAAIAQ